MALRKHEYVFSNSYGSGDIRADFFIKISRREVYGDRENAASTPSIQKH